MLLPYGHTFSCNGEILNNIRTSMLTNKIGITLIKMIHTIEVTGRNGSSGSVPPRDMWKLESNSISPVDIAMVLKMARAGVENVSRWRGRVSHCQLTSTELIVP